MQNNDEDQLFLWTVVAVVRLSNIFEAFNSNHQKNSDQRHMSGFLFSGMGLGDMEDGF